jgi:hypothetical protein
MSLIEKKWVDHSISFARKMIETNGYLDGVLMVGDFKKGKRQLILIPIDTSEPFSGLKKTVSVWKAKLAADMIDATIAMTIYEGWSLSQRDQETVKDYISNQEKYAKGVSSHPKREEVCAVNVELAGKNYSGSALLVEKMINGVKIKTFGSVDLRVIPNDKIGGRFTGFLKCNRRGTVCNNRDDLTDERDEVCENDDSECEVINFSDLIKRKR